MANESAVLSTMIEAIGESDFAGTVAGQLCNMTNFELSTVLIHRPESNPVLMFENFAVAGYGLGMKNYLRFTHNANPVVARKKPSGVYRASQLSVSRPYVRNELKDFITAAPEEELGYRTAGWPERLEEIGLYFPVGGGLLELSLYRKKSTSPVASDTLHRLFGLSRPLVSAFEKHCSLSRPQPASAAAFAKLSPREREVAELLLVGCSTEAIALRLEIKRFTVKDHRKLIFRKLGISSLAEFFAISVKR